MLREIVHSSIVPLTNWQLDLLRVLLK